jgi:hypothetical protein
MNRLRYLVAVMVILAATACVDDGFQLDEASTQVTVGGDVTTLPLGYLEKQKLGDIHITVEKDYSDKDRFIFITNEQNL